MMGITHWVIGGASWLGLLVGLEATGSPVNALVIGGGFAVASIAALEPDIDSKGSMASRMLGPITGVISYLVRHLFGGHRKITHSILGALILTFGIVAFSNWLHIPSWIGGAVIVGWVSHVLADMTTKVGCPLLWPVHKKNYGLHFVVTNGNLERYFIRPMAIVACVALTIMLLIGV